MAEDESLLKKCFEPAYGYSHVCVESMSPPHTHISRDTFSLVHMYFIQQYVNATVHVYGMCLLCCGHCV